MKNRLILLMTYFFVTAASPFAAFAQTDTLDQTCAPEALGTSRILRLNREFVGYGREQYGQLPLQKGEIVLTFDDGPLPETLDRVLKTLAEECVKATFYMTGANLSKHPELGQRIVQAGHTAGLHSFAHPHLGSMPVTEQISDLEAGLKTFTEVFGHEPATYRFPFLAETPTILAMLKERKITIASMDLGIQDYWPNDMQPSALVARLVEQLDRTSGGILLMHDANGPTADALPDLLRTIKEKGYRVVHLHWEEPITSVNTKRTNNEKIPTAQ